MQEYTTISFARIRNYGGAILHGEGSQAVSFQAGQVPGNCNRLLGTLRIFIVPEKALAPTGRLCFPLLECVEGLLNAAQERNESVLVSAHTSAGKTAVAE